MKLVLGQEDQRLSRHDRTRPLFEILKQLSTTDADQFVASIVTVGEPCVLFWHEDAEAALDLLASLQSTGTWPQNLHGVVLYRAALFAGLESSVRAQGELHARELAGGLVHIFEPEVAEPPDEWVVDRIVSFARAAAGWEGGPAPLVQLGDEGPSYRRLALSLLDIVLRSRAELEGELLRPGTWSKICGQFRADGIDCPETPTPGAFRKAVAALRGEFGAPALPCGPCGLRGILGHDPVQAQSGRSLAAGTRVIHEAIGDARDMLDRPPEAELELNLRQVLCSLSLGHLLDELLGLARDRFAASCRVAMLRADSAETAAEFEKVFAAAVERPDRAARWLETFLRCENSASGQVPV